MSVMSPARPAPAGPAPEGPLRRLAHWSIRHRLLAVVLWVALVAASLVGGSLTGMHTATTADGSGDSGRAERALQSARFPATITEHVLVSGSPERARAVARELRDRLGGLPEVASASPPVTGRTPGSLLLSVRMAVDGATGEAAQSLAQRRVPAVLAVTAAVGRAHPEVSVGQMGDASMNRAVQRTVADDFQRAELLSVPVTLVILLVTFGALFAAGVPVLLAISAVASALGLSAVASHVVPVGQFAGSVTLLIGMAVGVDYSLFYVRRAREERAAGASARQALDVAASTSGRAVVVSGLAVVVSMAGLLLSGQTDFVGMATGTILVVAVAVVGSLTVLPAVLSLLGDRLDRPRVPLLHRAARPGRRPRFWPAAMRLVLARPAISFGLAAGALMLLALPATGMRLGESGADALPRSIPEVRTYDRITSEFPQTGFAHTLVISAADGTRLDPVRLQNAVAGLRQRAARIRGFADLSGATPRVAPDGRTAVVDLPVIGDLSGADAVAALTSLRAELVPRLRAEMPGVTTHVTGPTASARDFMAVMRQRLPLVMAFVLALTLVILTAAFRSVTIAVTAVLLNLLSVGAAYGLLTVVFQHGFGASALGAVETGYVVDWLPLFLFVVLFGLSMDYQVFVVSRIREARDAGLPTSLAVSRGVTASAGVVTSAAAVMVGVFSIFGMLSLVEFKQMGVGLAAAILIDATIVRAVLLPAAMTLLGRRNWWMPARLARLLPAGH